MSDRITFSDTVCPNITYDNNTYWNTCPELHCNDEKFCNNEAQIFVEKASFKEYVYHSNKSICYAETYFIYLFKIDR